jgi:hypothetical protein
LVFSPCPHPFQMGASTLLLCWTFAWGWPRPWCTYTARCGCRGVVHGGCGTGGFGCSNIMLCLNPSSSHPSSSHPSISHPSTSHPSILHPSTSHPSTSHSSLLLPVEQNVLHSDLKSRNVMLKNKEKGGLLPKVGVDPRPIPRPHCSMLTSRHMNGYGMGMGVHLLS